MTAAMAIRPLKTLTANTWYCLWVVVNNAADTMKLYLKTDVQDATADDLLLYQGTQSTFGTHYSSLAGPSLRRAQNNNASLKVYVDDISIMPGESLSVPQDLLLKRVLEPANGATMVGTDSNTGGWLVLKW